MAPMPKIDCLMCAWRRLWELNAQKLLLHLPWVVQKEEEEMREMRLLTQHKTDCHQVQAVGPPTLKSRVDQLCKQVGAIQEGGGRPRIVPCHSNQVQDKLGRIYPQSIVSLP